MFEHVINNIPSTTIGKSQVHGFGLFSKSSLPEGVLLATLLGQVVPWWLYEQTPLAEEWNSLSDEMLLVRPYRTKYYYINHSRKPNLTTQKGLDYKIYLMTKKEILAGEELLLDYRNEPLPETYLKGHGATYL